MINQKYNDSRKPAAIPTLHLIILSGVWGKLDSKEIDGTVFLGLVRKLPSLKERARGEVENSLEK
jgi:hypothetical protein